MATPLEAMIGQVLDDHYRLDALLGAGGMGAVYRARHTSLQKDVAVKVLHPDIGGDPSISKRFDREAHSASRLDHPNCVRVSDFGTTPDGVKYLVMDLLEGKELGASLGKPWDPAQACVVLDQILAGLEHAHHCGIVHRDLKPENVFMVEDIHGQQVAKIVDFGIAKLLDADGAAEVLTRAGMVFGTPRYMSPEQAAGGKVDERSDLYSAGLLAFELLSGRPPFESDDLAAILRMQIMAPPPPLPTTVPAPLAAWVESLIEKSRHQRPASAELARAQLAELREHLRERSTTARGADGQTDPPIDALGATNELAAADLTAATGELGQAVHAPLPSKPEHMPGHTVAGRFRLIALLGVGGMGAVFRAEDSQTGTPVAVKILHAALADDEELAARFEREAQTASELDHPNIVPVFTHGTTAGAGNLAHYLVMPLLEGVELREVIQAGVGVDPVRAAHLVLQLLHALAHAHAHQVVHRDLKPENVFVIRDGAGNEVVQLVDFGLAKVAEAGASRRALTQFGQVFGTPAYMSPEQCRGEIVDARTDIYATGVILYELLAGHPPFISTDPVTLLRMQLASEPPALPLRVPVALRELVADLLIKDRDRRVPDAITAITAIEAALAGPGSHAQPPPTASGATMFADAPIPAGASHAHSPSPIGIHGAPGASHAHAPTPPGLPLAPASTNKIPRSWLYAGAGVFAILIIIALLPGGSASDGGEQGDDGEQPADTADDNGGNTHRDEPDGAHAKERPKPDGSVYVEIDRLLIARDTATALQVIAQARDEFPEDGGLLWRDGRALALAGGDANRVTALHRYAEAAASEASLAKQTEFEAELRNLLRDKKLRSVAIDVAVRDLGGLGHTFLLEVINDETSTLGYVTRHRIIDELQHDPSMVARMDLRRQLALDLREAADSPTPCGAFSKALDTIVDSDDPYYLDALHDRALRVPDAPGPGEAESACVGLDAKLAKVQGQLAANHPEAAAKATKAAKKKKKKSGPFRGIF
ncbi:Serine/threonine-protein kinase pkn2 [Enhygromyxa salina]|uniref:Serine/threonine-protein kinase pkn2 n=1 Tax=Enhygromyxa salina TaxID=215803 RepID=A0A0C2D8Z5_9BACT|nr:serine/threonine-protein kinase [Enhygromyxa salina]KIG16452.1 Serine/threonine-protein kinase pkn2 [Enhygromyxa salina]